MSETFLIGVDPGKAGGIAWFEKNKGVQAVKMPGTDAELLKLCQRLYNLGIEGGFLAKPVPVKVLIELVGGFVKPPKVKAAEGSKRCPACGKAEVEEIEGQPGSAMFTFGEGAGLVRGMFLALGAEVELVYPKRWQEPFFIQKKGRTKTQWKNVLKATAQRRFPGFKVTLATADALLLLEFGRMKYADRCEEKDSIRDMELKEKTGWRNGTSHGLFECPVCGAIVERDLSSGRRNKTCGCGRNYEEHGLSKDPERKLLYGVWASMRSRCNCETDKAFPRYGARGISVCPEWVSFPAFLNWAESNGYQSGLEIDRKDNNGNYEPGNCRWISHAVNSRNRELKLTEEQAAEIIKRRAAGELAKTLAAEFGVSEAHICRVGKGRYWKPIPSGAPDIAADPLAGQGEAPSSTAPPAKSGPKAPEPGLCVMEWKSRLHVFRNAGCGQTFYVRLATDADLTTLPRR